MSKEMILVSSGFIIPSNRLFSVVTKDTTYRNSILSKKNGTGKDVILDELIKTGTLNSSATCNDLYTAYVHDSSADNLLNLVDAIAEVFKGLSLKDFMMTQAKNTYLSPLGFKLCMDLATDKLHKTYREYLVSPSFFRVAKPSEISSDEISARISSVEKLFTSDYRLNFVTVIAGMMADKGPLAAFFQYVLTDSNRGGMYG